MKLKRLVAIFLSTSLMISIAACNKDDRNKGTEKIIDRIEDIDLDEFEYEDEDGLLDYTDEIEDGFYLDLTDADDIESVVEESVSFSDDINLRDIERFVIAGKEDHDVRFWLYSFQFKKLEDAEDFYEDMVERREDLRERMTSYDFEIFEEDEYCTYVATILSRDEIVVYDYEITDYTVTLVISGTMIGQLPEEIYDYYEASDRDDVLDYLEEYQ